MGSMSHREVLICGLRKALCLNVFRGRSPPSFAYLDEEKEKKKSYARLVEYTEPLPQSQPA